MAADGLIEMNSYVYNGKYHDLGRAIEGVRTFNKFVNSVVRVEVDGKQDDPKDHFAALCIELRISPEDLTKAST